MYYLLLDEIQMLDCFEAVLNSYLRKDNMDVFVTGSNAKFLSKDIATEFAGRGDEVHMGDMDGVTMAKKLRQENDTVQIICCETM